MKTITLEQAAMYDAVLNLGGPFVLPQRTRRNGKRFTFIKGTWKPEDGEEIENGYDVEYQCVNELEDALPSEKKEWEKLLKKVKKNIHRECLEKDGYIIG